MLLLLSLGCWPTVDPLAALPPGGFVSTTGPALAELSACLAPFAGSRVAEVGADWAALAATCPGEVYGQGPGALMDLRCRAAPEAVRAFRGEAVLAYAAPRLDIGLPRGHLEREGPGLRLTARLPLPDDLGALALAVPGAETAGPPVLADHDAVVHARLRPSGGIDVSALVESGTQADTLFGLKGALLSRAVLTGDWEFAAYPPVEGGEVPQLALAVGLRPDAGRVAVAAFADGLREKWSVQRQSATVGGHAGECLAGLRIMPQFEPCYVVTSTHLVAGWNQRAVESALAGGDWPGIDTTSGGVASVDFRAMRKADAGFAASRPPESTLPPLDYPLDRVTASARPVDDELEVVLRSARGCQP